MEEHDSAWEMPSEAEMKTIQARQERRDKISSLMGQYLLKGYAMLSTECTECATILMKDRQGNLICVACTEVDTTECAKDDPALSSEAARKRAVESTFLSSTPSTPTETPVPEAGRGSVKRKNPGQGDHAVNHNVLLDSPTRDAYVGTEIIVLAKMQWAAQQLQNSPSIESSIALCTLVHKCAETLAALQKLSGTSINCVAESRRMSEEFACASSTSQ